MSIKTIVCLLCHAWFVLLHTFCTNISHLIVFASSRRPFRNFLLGCCSLVFGKYTGNLSYLFVILEYYWYTTFQVLSAYSSIPKRFLDHKSAASIFSTHSSSLPYVWSSPHAALGTFQLVLQCLSGSRMCCITDSTNARSLTLSFRRPHWCNISHVQKLIQVLSLSDRAIATCLIFDYSISDAEFGIQVRSSQCCNISLVLGCVASRIQQTLAHWLFHSVGHTDATSLTSETYPGTIPIRSCHSHMFDYWLFHQWRCIWYPGTFQSVLQHVSGSRVCCIMDSTNARSLTLAFRRPHWCNIFHVRNLSRYYPYLIVP